MEETMKRYSVEFIEALDYFGACMKSALEKQLDDYKNQKI